jgi:hypothetical protein
MNPLCINCKKLYVPVKTGFSVAINENCVRRGDKMQCPSCKHEIVTGFGENFHSPIEAKNAPLKVNASEL